jgi:uncharacterized protein YjdB
MWHKWATRNETSHWLLLQVQIFRHPLPIGLSRPCGHFMPHDNFTGVVIKAMKARTECALRGMRHCRRVALAMAETWSFGTARADAKMGRTKQTPDELNELIISGMKRNMNKIFSRHGFARLASNHLVILTLVFLGLPCLLSAQTLEHRYSFVSDASDSVGGANWNGKIVAPTTGSPATISGGLNLPGNAGGGNVAGYVAFPSGILVGDTSLTIECWFTENSQNGWATVWDFANSPAGSENFEMCPYPDNNNHNLMSAFSPNSDEQDVQSTNSIATGIEQYVSVTYDNATLSGIIYLNGAQVGTRVFPNSTYAPGTIGGAAGTSQNWLGNDTFGDPQFSGTVYEFRIWNGVVPQRQIAAAALLGPGVVISETNLTPTSASVTAGPSIVVTGTEQATVNVTIKLTGTTNLVATVDATNWTSSNPSVLTVNSSGLITGVSPGTATVSATVAGVTTGNSGTITVSPVTLQNRYSFATDATDSVSGADGTLEAPIAGGSATISNGLFLPGNTVGGFGYSGYLSLPSEILTNTTSITVECWVTENQYNTWAELWDFGNNGNQNFALIPYSGSGNTRVAFTPNADEIDINANVLPTNSDLYVVVTYNNSTLVGSLYTNGVLDSSTQYPDAIFAPGDTVYAPGSIGGAGGTTENMLGNDVYGDDQFDGVIHEFRIWNGAVSPVYVALSAATGPSVVVTNLTPLTVTVTVTTNMVGAQTQQATVVGNFAAATNVNLTGAVTTWTSSATNILTVSSTGLITALSGGSATVSATVDGVTATSASITVALTAPSITQQPASASVAVGDSVTFTVVAVGGDLTYQWSDDSTPIAGATGATLTLTNLAIGQSGSYSVLVTNALGSTNSVKAVLTVAQAVLEHRYSFVSDASDSVGGPAWNGTLQPGSGGIPATISNGLVLPGNSGGGNGVSGYVSLPSGIVYGDTSVTVETWVQPNSDNTWAEIWDFGSSGSVNFALIQYDDRTAGTLAVAFTPNGGELDIVAPNLLPATSPETYIVVTYNNSTLTGDLYTNGLPDGSVLLPNSSYSPGSYGGVGGTTENTLGNDVYGDPQFGGTIYEVRIWNGVVSQTYIAASALLGPSIVVSATNLIPTSVSVAAGPSVGITGTEQATVNVTLKITGTTNLLVTGDATNWTSGNTSVLTVNSSGLITGVGPGSTTVSATVGGITGTSGTITVAPAALEHRYSFVADASDSVGGPTWNGTLVAPSTGAAATISNGLFLPGNTVGGSGYSGYVSLPSGILTNTSSVTIECWMTEIQANTWAETWDFGNNGSQNFGLIPYSGSHNTRVAFTPNNGGAQGYGEVDIDSSALATNAEEYVVATYNNFTLTGDLYTNGVLDATQTFPGTEYSPGSIGGPGGTTENMLGNDVYGDPQFDGVIYEFRIWNGAVSPLYVAVSAAAGPSVVVTNLKPTSVTVTVATNMDSGGTQQATVVGNFANGTNVTVTDAALDWTSSETNVLTVSSSGLITAVGGGKATVSATVGGVTATSASITVAVTAVTLGIAPSGKDVVISWQSGTLLEATNLLGPWVTNTTAVSPFTVAATNTSEFFKILVNP